MGKSLHMQLLPFPDYNEQFQGCSGVQQILHEVFRHLSSLGGSAHAAPRAKMRPSTHQRIVIKAE